VLAARALGIKPQTCPREGLVNPVVAWLESPEGDAWCAAPRYGDRERLEHAVRYANAILGQYRLPGAKPAEHAEWLAAALAAVLMALRDAEKAGK
jgi:hypothetical protein